MFCWPALVSAGALIFAEGAISPMQRSVEGGADVWIGNNVSLMSGIRIGTGAVIATGAVVVSDVAPYAIVGGVPAREIRKRFDDEQIAYLLASRWWERPFDELRKEADSFSDIGLFMKNGL